VDASTPAAAVGHRAHAHQPGVLVRVRRLNVEHPDVVSEELRRQGQDARLNPGTRSRVAALPGAAGRVSSGEPGARRVRSVDHWFDDLVLAIAFEPLANHVSRIAGVSRVTPTACRRKSCHGPSIGGSPRRGSLPP
jgi:hypothetical protein